MIYRVIVANTDGFRLVEAKSRAAAKAFVADKLITAEPATFEDGRQARELNIAVETVTVE